MTDFSTIRPTITAVPKGQTITKAGQLGSTFEDTSTWLPLENGHNIQDGELALSTSTATVVTNAQNLYTDLWARSPLAWKSGSDLTIPAQSITGLSNWVDAKTEMDQSAKYPRNTGITHTSQSFTYYRYRLGGGYMEVEFRWNASAIGAGTDAIEIQLPDAIEFGLSGVTTAGFGAGGDQKIVVNAVTYGVAHANPATTGFTSAMGGSVSNGDFLTVYRAGGSNGITGDNLDTTNIQIYIKAQFKINETTANDQTPTISLWDNTASSSFGLPDASATSKGLLTLDQIDQRNLIINGGKDINQKSFSSGAIGTGAEYKITDRFVVEKSGSSTTVNGFYWTADTPDANVFSHSTRYQVTATSGGAGLFTQTRLEAVDIKKHIGKQVCFSLYAKAATGTPTMKMKVYSAAVEDTWTTDMATTPDVEEFSKTIATTSDWVRHSLVFTVPQNCENGIALGLESDSGTSLALNDIILDGGWQLELGNEPTAFKRAGGTLAGEQALCQRYAYVFDSTDTNTFGYGHKQTSTSIRYTIPTDVKLRVLPSIEVVSPAQVRFVGSVGTSAFGTSVGSSDAFTAGGVVFVYSDAGLSGLVNPIIAQGTGAAGGKIILDAEL